VTVIVGFVGADGAVMASDSEGTEGGHSRIDVEKCWTCGGLLFGLSGTGSVKQPLEASLATKATAAFGESVEVSRWEARELVRGAVRDVFTREYTNFVPGQPGQTALNTIGCALLVIGRDSDGYWLLEIVRTISRRSTTRAFTRWQRVVRGLSRAWPAEGIRHG